VYPQPAASSQQPAASSQQPVASSQQPAASSQQPAASGQSNASAGCVDCSGPTVTNFCFHIFRGFVTGTLLDLAPCDCLHISLSRYHASPSCKDWQSLGLSIFARVIVPSTSQPFGSLAVKETQPCDCLQNAPSLLREARQPHHARMGNLRNLKLSC
jgi:hypothetical protein